MAWRGGGGKASPPAAGQKARGLSQMTRLALAGLVLMAFWGPGPAQAAIMACECPDMPSEYQCNIQGGNGVLTVSCRNTPLGPAVEMECRVGVDGVAWFCARTVDGKTKYLVAGLSGAETAQLLDDVEMKCPCGWSTKDENGVKPATNP